VALHRDRAIDKFHIVGGERSAAGLALDGIHLYIAREIDIEGYILNGLFGRSCQAHACKYQNKSQNEQYDPIDDP